MKGLALEVKEIFFSIRWIMGASIYKRSHAFFDVCKTMLGKKQGATKNRVFVWVWMFRSPSSFRRLISHLQMMCRKKMRPTLVLKHSKFLGFGSPVVGPLAVVTFFF